MYIPKQFEEPRVDVMHELIRARPLATLTKGTLPEVSPQITPESPVPVVSIVVDA